MPAGAVITLKGTYLGRQWVNVFSYATLDSPSLASYDGLLSAFWDTPSGSADFTPVDGIQATVSNQVQISSAELVSPWEPDLYLQIASATRTGTNTATPAPSFVAYGFYTDRQNRTVRRGYKRIPGVLQAHIVGGNVISAPALEEIAVNMGEAFSRQIDVADGSNTVNWLPCVFGRPPLGLFPPENPPRYYPTIEQQLTRTSIGVTYFPYPTVRSQVSRKAVGGA